MTSLTVLYTANLRGGLDLLPPLFTFLKRLRVEYAADSFLLFDLGDACAGGVWHCDATGGRSMLVGLDGMGCDAANTSGYLTAEARAKLIDMGELVHLTLLESPAVYPHADLQIHLTPAPAASLDGSHLYLASVATREVGVVHLIQEDSGWRLTAGAVYLLPPGTLPDPTIAGLVDFITSEARQAQKKRGAP